MSFIEIVFWSVFGGLYVSHFFSSVKVVETELRFLIAIKLNGFFFLSLKTYKNSDEFT